MYPVIWRDVIIFYISIALEDWLSSAISRGACTSERRRIYLLHLRAQVLRMRWRSSWACRLSSAVRVNTCARNLVNIAVNILCNFKESWCFFLHKCNCFRLIIVCFIGDNRRKSLASAVDIPKYRPARKYTKDVSINMCFDYQMRREWYILEK